MCQTRLLRVTRDSFYVSALEFAEELVICCCIFWNSVMSITATLRCLVRIYGMNDIEWNARHCETWSHLILTVYPKKYAHGLCFAVLCCGYTLTDFPISIRLTSLALWQSNDCPSASKATLMNMDKYFMWIHYERLHNHNKAKHNKTVCIFLGIYCNYRSGLMAGQVGHCLPRGRCVFSE